MTLTSHPKLPYMYLHMHEGARQLDVDLGLGRRPYGAKLGCSRGVHVFPRAVRVLISSARLH